MLSFLLPVILHIFNYFYTRYLFKKYKYFALAYQIVNFKINLLYDSGFGCFYNMLLLVIKKFTSIFMASRTMRGCPTLTESPTLTCICEIFEGMGVTTECLRSTDSVLNAGKGFLKTVFIPYKLHLILTL